MRISFSRVPCISRRCVGSSSAWSGGTKSAELKNFAQFFKLDEVRIITADGEDVGWIQEQIEDATINLGSFYVTPVMQRQGVGTQTFRYCWDAPRSKLKQLPWAW